MSDDLTLDEWAANVARTTRTSQGLPVVADDLVALDRLATVLASASAAEQGTAAPASAADGVAGSTRNRGEAFGEVRRTHAARAGQPSGLSAPATPSKNAKTARPSGKKSGPSSLQQEGA